MRNAGIGEEKVVLAGQKDITQGFYMSQDRKKKDTTFPPAPHPKQ